MSSVTVSKLFCLSPTVENRFAVTHHSTNRVVEPKLGRCHRLEPQGSIIATSPHPTPESQFIHFNTPDTVTEPGRIVTAITLGVSPMSATPTPKKPGTGTNGTSSRSSTGDSPGTHSRSPSKGTNGLQRTPSGRASPVSARAAARKPGRSNLSVSSVPKVTNTDSSDEEARAQNAALIEELKEQLQKAESASEQYRKQLEVLQLRLDEAIAEQTRLEDQAHEKESKIEALNSEIREHARQLRDLEQAHERERNAMLQDKEQQASREEELQATIQRLKESLAQKEKERANTEGDKNVSRSCKFPRASLEYPPC